MSMHAVAHAAAGTLLFRTHREAVELWRRLTRSVRTHALALLPDHVHGKLPDAGVMRAFTDALRGYALWRNYDRGECGRVFQHDIDATPVRGRQHDDRTTRYIHLNACRAGLVEDPLAWPYSTHRDAVGLAIPPACRPVRDPAAFHGWVSADPAVALSGSALPVCPGGPVTLEQLCAAVSALTRTPASGLLARGPARDLLIRAARTLTTAGSAEIAARIGVDASTVRRHAKGDDPLVRLAARVAGDPRFALLPDGDLRNSPAWRRAYPGRR